MLTAGSSWATVVTQTVTFGPGLTDYTAAAGVTGTGGTTFSFFDSALGTLNAVTFGSTYGFSSAINVTNAAASGIGGSTLFQSAAQLGASDAAVKNVLNAQVNRLNDPVDGTAVSFGSSSLSPIAYDLRGTKRFFDLLPGASTSLSSTGSGSTGPVTDTAAADLAVFSRTGGGVFTPLFTTLSGLLVSSSGGNLQTSQVTTGTATLALTYDYTPATYVAVPEPGSLAALSAGLFGLGLVRRRRT